MRQSYVIRSRLDERAWGARERGLRDQGGRAGCTRMARLNCSEIRGDFIYFHARLNCLGLCDPPCQPAVLYRTVSRDTVPGSVCTVLYQVCMLRALSHARALRYSTVSRDTVRLGAKAPMHSTIVISGREVGAPALVAWPSPITD